MPTLLELSGEHKVNSPCFILFSGSSHCPIGIWCEPHIQLKTFLVITFQRILKSNLFYKKTQNVILWTCGTRHIASVQQPHVISGWSCMTHISHFSSTFTSKEEVNSEQRETFVGERFQVFTRPIKTLGLPTYQTQLTQCCKVFLSALHLKTKNCRSLWWQSQKEKMLHLICEDEENQIGPRLLPLK